MDIHDAIADKYGPMTAQSYDGIAGRLFWGYPETLSAIAAEVVYARRSTMDSAPVIRSVLDIGIGTGNVSARLIEELRRAEAYIGRVQEQLSVSALDYSPHMSEVARAKLSAMPGVQVEIRIGDLKDTAAIYSDKRFDCIVSGFAIHHLDGVGKAALIRDLLGLLNPGGILVIGDRMPSDEQAGSRDGYHAVIASRWLELYEGTSERPTLSRTMSDLDKAFEADGDRPSSAAEHLAWFEAAGFADSRRPFYSFGCGVVSGVRTINS